MPDVQQASWEVAPAWLSAHSPMVEFGPVPLQLYRLLFWTVFCLPCGPGACREPMLWVLGDPDRCKGETFSTQGWEKDTQMPETSFSSFLQLGQVMTYSVLACCC